MGDVISEPVGPSVAEGASVLDGGKVESAVAGTVVEPSIGTDVATCGSWRDGPPGAVVVTARVVTGAVVDEPPAVVVVDGSPVTVVDAPSAIVVLEVSIGEIG